MFVANIMTTPVISVDPSMSIGVAAKLMLANRISGLPVIDRNCTLVGMLSEGDFLRRSELGTERKRSRWIEFFLSPGKIAEDYVQTHGRRVEEVMSEDLITTRLDASLGEVAETMIKRHVKCLPVVKSGKVVGIVTRSDLMGAMARALPKVGAVAADDTRILTAVQSELSRQSWSSNGLIRVNVVGGAVELSGIVFDSREQLAARVAAENVPGVKSVSDHLVWVEPASGMVILGQDDRVAQPAYALGSPK